MADDQIASKVLEDLHDTNYACSSLSRLSGGSANFTYRGILTHPLPDGSSTVVVKHAEPYIATATTWKLDVARSDFEQKMLASLSSCPPLVSQNIYVTTPTLYKYDSQTDTQILYDYPSSLELKKYITTHASSLTLANISRLGTTLGLWTCAFHTWAAAPQQAELREQMKANDMMANLKLAINYGRLEATIPMFPSILETDRDLFQAVAAKFRSEKESRPRELIHGDFWCGNVLLRDAPLPPLDETLTLLVIDWEMAHLGSRAFDLGQMFAELFLLQHFRGIEAGQWMIAAVMAGYGALGEEMALQVALHFGTHLVVWPCRVAGWGEGEVMQRCVQVGRDCIRHAFRGEIEWFRGGVLDSVFFHGGEEP